MHIVLIATSGNQNYIFSTNKLRENVGASELTYRVGTKTVLRALKSFTGKELYEGNELSTVLRKNLMDPERNPPIGKDGNKVEVIVATSGKAILLVDDDKDKKLSKQIISNVTQAALREMPGVTVHGAISQDFPSLEALDADGEQIIHKAIRETHRKVEDIRYRLPGNEQRFLRLPFSAQCGTSNLPAQTTDKEGGNTILVSNLSKVKSDNKGKGVSRIAEMFAPLNLIDPEDIEKCEWSAVIHADGNGLGQIFQEFNKYAGFDENGKWNGRQYVDDYRKFSLALDVGTVNATKTSLEHLWNSIATQAAKKQQKEVSQLTAKELNALKLPVVPLVLGGDDLTVLCDGQYALKFTHDFLKAFEEEVAKNHDLVGDIVKRIAPRAFGKNYLGICAGIAIVKPHFPFHQAYALAEQLLKSAKSVKERIHHIARVRTREGEGEKEVQLPASALDVHVLYDSAYSGLDAIRGKLQVDNNKTLLYAKPYVVTDQKELSGARDKSWFEYRKFADLQKRVTAMLTSDADDPTKRSLPYSQLHDLREALFLGANEADARMSLIRQRYVGINELLCRKNGENEASSKWSLFFGDGEDEDDKCATHFMDALDLIGFWKGFDEPKKIAGGIR